MSLNQIYKDFQEFNYKNQILNASAGVIFGLASKQYIEDFLNDIILKIIKLFISIELFIYKNPLTSIFVKLIWITFMWIVTIFLAFIILEYILYRGFLGLSSTIIKEDDKIDFEKIKKLNNF
jgi:large-conductance mechanosensitive channel